MISLRRPDNISHGRSHGRFYSSTTQSLNMEHVGTLAEANNVLSPTIIALYGLLSPPAEQEETCHFCFKTITKGQFMVLKLLCCGHLVHTCCFKTRASTSLKEFVVHCAYCRTAYLYEDTCFLCLPEDTQNATAQHAVIRDSTQNAAQISQSCSHSCSTNTR